MIQPIPSATSVISSPLTSTHTSPPLVVVGSQHVVFVQRGDLAVVISELSQHGISVLASPRGRRAHAALVGIVTERQRLTDERHRIEVGMSNGLRQLEMAYLLVVPHLADGENRSTRHSASLRIVIHSATVCVRVRSAM